MIVICLLFVDTRTVYATVVDAEDHLEHVDGHEFAFKEFTDHPEKFRSSFNEEVCTSLLNNHLIVVFLDNTLHHLSDQWNLLGTW